MTVVLLFDGDCAFCSTSARALQRWVRPRCLVLPYQHVDLERWHTSRDEAAAEVLLLRRSGDTVVRLGGAAAIAAALRLGVAPWPVAGVLLELPGVRTGARALYRAVARHRHRMPGGTPACALDGATSVAAVG